MATVEYQREDQEMELECRTKETQDSLHELESDGEDTEKSGKHGDQMWMNLILMATMLLLLSVEIAITLSQYVVGVDLDLIGSICLDVSLVVGILSLCILFQQSITGKVRIMESKRQEKPWNALLRNSLSIVGLAFFCPFTCLLEFYQIFMSIYCIQFGRPNEIVDMTFITDVVFHLLRCIFITMELLFCVQFRSMIFADDISPKRKFLIYLSLMLLAVVNIGQWFDAVVREAADTYVSSHEGQSVVYTDDYNTTQSLIACSTRMLGSVSDTVRRSLYPFTIEFLLLVLEFVASRFVMQKHFHEGDHEASHGSNQQHPRGPEKVQHPEMIVCVEDCSSDSSSTLSDPDSPQEIHHRHRIFGSKSPMIVGLGILPNLLCILFAFFATKATDGTPVMNYSINQYLRFILFYWIVACLLIVIGVVCGRKLKHGHKKLKGFDYLVMFSGFGPFLSLSMRVIVVVWNFDLIGATVDPVVITIAELLNFLMCLLQLPFLFYADRVKCSAEDEEKTAGKIFKATVVSLAVYNFTLWLIDSVLLKVDILGMIFQGSNWLLLDEILRPFIIFFRFNSALIFLRSYLH